MREAARFAPATIADGRADEHATTLDCPAATLTYAISNECAQALSHSEAQQALAFANAAIAQANQHIEQ